MIKGLMHAAAMAAMATWICSSAQAEVYKVVDEHGNVTYTDQAPPDGSAPIELPELSVIETDYPPAEAAAGSDDQPPESSTDSALTPRQLRKMYQDFRISRPAQEETIWGTDRPVVVSWNSSAALQPDMSVRLFVNGQAMANTQDQMAALELVRGEYQVYAELLDARGRRIVATPTVTFFVKQSAIGNQPIPTPHAGS
jgi:hypothetical protein